MKIPLSCLLQLFTNGKLQGARVSFFKAKYEELADLLRTTRESESRYLYEAKDLTQKCQKQQTTIDQGEAFPAGE